MSILVLIDDDSLLRWSHEFGNEVNSFVADMRWGLVGGFPNHKPVIDDFRFRIFNFSISLIGTADIIEPTKRVLVEMAPPISNSRVAVFYGCHTSEVNHPLTRTTH